MASEECKTALKLLARSRNVLISGPPGTGKSRLLAEVALAFENGHGLAAAGGPPQLNPKGGIPIPPAAGREVKDIPAPTKRNRKVFRTVFHQNSKHRDFVSGISPAVRSSEVELGPVKIQESTPSYKGAGATMFVIVEGTLYRASQYAKGTDAAALLIVDEINRGPAVQVFGGSIVAIEPDKRLGPDNAKRAETQYFEILDPATGNQVEYALPLDLFVLAAMNQADASVEPLDVAFLRRWEPMRLEPNEAILREFYGLGAKGNNPLPETPGGIADFLEASVRAWASVNQQIALGRGPEFQIGHGVLMFGAKPQTVETDDALASLCIGWAKVRAHVEEVFFGDIRGIAAALNALDGPSYNPFRLTETTFADDLRFRLEGPANVNEASIYRMLRAFGRS